MSRSRNCNRLRRRRGFTLMEILLVLAILVILGALVGVAYDRIQRNARIDSAKTQINMLESGVETFQLDVGTYPSSDDGLAALLNAPSAGRADKWRGPYIKATQLPDDPWGNKYNYELLSSEQYLITSSGPDGQQGTNDDVQIIR